MPTIIQAKTPRMLMLAFSCDPDETMEERNGWWRAVQAAELFHVTVLTDSRANVSRLQSLVPLHVKDRIEFIAVSISRFSLWCLCNQHLFYIGYRAWQIAALSIAEKLHSESPFALSQLVSLCGFREPSYLWKLDAPFVLGPVGGTSGFPLRYLSIVHFSAGVFELFRNLLNAYQVRVSPRIASAIRNAAVTIAANSSSQQHLQSRSPTPIRMELETGIDHEVSQPRSLRNANEPFRILWTGRLRAWKGLPILLHAIAQLPDPSRVRVRVLGSGHCKSRWQKLADRLSISETIEWIDRPHYRQSFEHYDWADVFAFTSLRDTSGTGLLEALAAGAPIIGLNHQGAADIMNASCAVPISVHSPSQSAIEFRDAILQLMGDSNRLKQLSDGALERVREFAWQNRVEKMHAIYDEVLAAARAKASHARPASNSVGALQEFSTPQLATQGRAATNHFLTKNNHLE